MEEKKKIQVFSHQQKVFNRLVDIANVCFSIQRKTFSLTPRANSLLIGPSGAGKTYLASAVASEAGAAFLPLSISEWVLIGCTTRGAVATWPSIVQFLLTNQKANGIVIFLDELDKLTGSNGWERFERTEIFKLLDLSVPTGLTDKDNDSFSNLDHRTAKEVLNRTLILGAGAFQHLWDSPPKSCIGFGNNAESALAPTLNQLSKSLPRELVNRFRSEVLILPQLGIRDYEEMLLKASEGIPAYLQQTFLELGLSRINKAVDTRQGCRFVEELLLDTVLVERAAMRKCNLPLINP